MAGGGAARGIERYRLVIVGAGSAGLAAADFAARLGVSVALVERDRVGGDCTWTGCVPSKALLHVAELAHTLRDVEPLGVARTEMDFAAAMAFVRQAIERVHRFETPEVLASRGITVIHGDARFVDARTLDVQGRRIGGERILIATGAHPKIPPLDGLDDVRYLTYQTVFDLTELPSRLIVLGGGPVGVELGQAFQRLGSQVTIIDRHERVAAMADPEASAVLQTALERDGVQLKLATRADRVVRSADDEIVVDIGAKHAAADALLVATGRRPNVAGLELDRAGVAWSSEGVVVDDWLRTSQKHIYACGDAIGSFQFTHYASWQAVLAVRNMLLPGRSRGRLETVPWTLFTEPKIAHAGLTERQARERYGAATRVVRWPIERVDRAVTEGETEGFIKLIHLSNGRLLGGTIVCRRAGELANELSVAVSRRLTLASLASAVHVYPTYGFALQQAAADGYFDQLTNGRLGAVIRQLANGWPRPRSSPKIRTQPR
jgi:pyruvate/2-oxoglutarate dehydrogenase complex dihydrolipoamide dehydrogenase (E3) component